MAPYIESDPVGLVQRQHKRKSTVKQESNTLKRHRGSETQEQRARNNFRNICYYNVPSTSGLRSIRFQYQPPVEAFIGRKEELSFLKQKLCIENPRVMVVCGLGGIGKTQLAKQFIKENKDFYRNVVWINSQDKESIEREFKTLAESELDLSLHLNGKEKDFRSIIHMTFDRLSTSKTLLVFDNVDKVDTASIVLDIIAVDVKPHILITSRIQEFSDSVNVVKLEVFSPEVALEYISTILDKETLEDKMALAATLKNLPLTMRQATAHIKYHRQQDENYKICNYIADFNKCREQILSSDLFQKDIFHHCSETTLTTWLITMNAIKECEPDGELALRILHIMAYFDNTHIMREIFLNLEGLSDEPELNRRQVISAVRHIINYSMVDDYECQSVLSIHKVVQEVIQIQLENEQRLESTLRDGLKLICEMVRQEKFKLCVEHGISVYLSALRFSELVIEFDTFPSMILRKLLDSGNYLRALSFGTKISEQFTAILGKDHQSTTLLQFEIARSYSELGRYSVALQMYETILAKQKIVLGEDHPHTILTKHNIAISCINLGKHSEAFQMFKEVLAKQEIVLGEDHPHTILTKNNIAISYINLDKYTEALQLFEESFKKMKIILGEDHPDTIRTKSNIADTYSKLGKYTQALQMYEDSFQKMKILLGEHHPDTIRTKSNIADTYIKLGKYTQALQMYEESFKMMKIVLGEDHPDTIRTKCNIADTYSNLGKYLEALQMYEEVSETTKIVLGEDHPDTILAESDIADSYRNLGKYFEALQLYKEVLEKQKIVLGEDHPDTILTKSNIADSYSNLGKYLEALQMYEEVSETTKIVFGEYHPNTIRTKSNIAYSYINLGKSTEALEMYEDIFSKIKLVLGEDHPDTILTKSNIANLYSNLGKSTEVLQMYAEILEKRKIILGEDHPDTLLTKSNIANLYCNLGKYSEALQIYDEVLAKQKIILGEDHPYTILAKIDIADSYSNLGKYSEALQMYDEVLAKQKIILGEDHPDTILTKIDIAYSYINLCKSTGEHQMYKETLEKIKNVLGEHNPDSILAKFDIADSFSHFGKSSKARRMYEEILEKIKIVLEDDDPDTIRTKSDMVDSYNNLGKYSQAFKRLNIASATEEPLEGRNTEKLSRKFPPFPPSEDKFDADSMTVTEHPIDSKKSLKTYVFGDGEHKFTIFVDTMKRLLSEQGRLREVDLSLPGNELPDLIGKSRREILDLLATRVVENHDRLVEGLKQNGIEFTVTPLTKNIFVKNCDWNTLFKISNLVSSLSVDLTVSGGGCVKYLGDTSNCEHPPLSQSNSKCDESVQRDDTCVKIGVIDSGCSSELFRRIDGTANGLMHPRMIDAVKSSEVAYEDCFLEKQSNILFERHGSGVVEIIANIMRPENARIFVACVGNGDVEYVINAMIKLVSLDIDVINCSLYVDKFSVHFHQSLRLIQSLEIVVVAAASEESITNYFADTSAIMVGSHNQKDMVSEYTKYQCTVNVCSHGEGVYMESVQPNLRNGTSYAAPLVTAAVAKVLSVRKQSPEAFYVGKLKNYLQDSAGSLTCSCLRHNGEQVKLKFDFTSFINYILKIINFQFD